MHILFTFNCNQFYCKKQLKDRQYIFAKNNLKTANIYCKKQLKETGGGKKIVVFSFTKVFELFENGQKKCPILKSMDIFLQKTLPLTIMKN